MELRISGQVCFELRDKYGKLKTRRIVPNLIVNEGLTYIADRLLVSPALPIMGYMAISTGVGAPVAGDTGLTGPEVDRVALTSITASSYSSIYAATFPTGTSGAITEAGVFTHVTPGHGDEYMLCRSTFAAVNKLTTDTLDITWTITFAAA
jgi:hypothetical protein